MFRYKYSLEFVAELIFKHMLNLNKLSITTTDIVGPIGRGHEITINDDHEASEGSKECGG